MNLKYKVVRDGKTWVEFERSPNSLEMADQTPAWQVAGVVLFYMAVALIMVMV